MVDLDDLEILADMLHVFVNRCIHLRDVDGIYMGDIKNEHIDFETIDWFTKNFMPLDIDKLHVGFNHVEISLNMKECEVAVQAQNEFVDEKGFKHKTTLWWYRSKDEKDSTELSTVVIENCTDCIYHCESVYDSEYKLRDKNSKIGYLSPLHDVDNKGGIAYWKYTITVEVGEEPFIGKHNYYKRNEITLEQKEKLFGCRHAFEDGVPMTYHGSFFDYRNKVIKKFREMKTRINGKIKIVNGHCKFYTPKVGRPNLNIYPVSYIGYKGMQKPYKKFVFKGKLRDFDPVEVKA